MLSGFWFGRLQSVEDLATNEATVMALADGTTRTLDLEDGTPACSVITVDPRFWQDSNKPNAKFHEICCAQVS